MNLTTINQRINADAAAFMAECDAKYEMRIQQTTEKIAANLKRSNLAFVSGPSASGKTTTAKKLELALRAFGIGTHVISMDSYFLPGSQTEHLRNEVGDRDYETPENLDLSMLREHFAKLSQCDEVLVPYFDFKRKDRNPDKVKPLCLKRDEIAIFEGIHALNPGLYEQCVANAFKLYISANTDIVHDGSVFVEHTLLRLLRRIVRDHNFRGTGIEQTLVMWDGVRRGEQKYIMPYKDSADYQFDTALGYEVAVLKPFVLPLFEGRQVNPVYAQLEKALPLFASVDESLIAKGSLLREFIGGGEFKY